MMSDGISGKKILFICPKFIGYDLAIKNEMENLGAQVTMCNDRPYNGFYDFFKNLNINFIKFHQKIVWFIRLAFIELDQVDTVLIIRGEHIPSFVLKRIKKQHVKMIMYQWDSVKNHDYLPQLEMFDRVFTFDKQDSVNYGLEYYPLFYRKDYQSLKAKTSLVNKALFVGTYQHQRYRSVLELRDILKKNNIKTTIIFKIPFYYYVKQLLRGNKLETKFLTFKNISFKKLLDLYADSDIIIDVANENQTGLTMRTFEALGANKQLITNNKSIALEPFYNAEQTQNLDGNFKWIKSAGPAIQEQRLDKWIIRIFN